LEDGKNFIQPDYAAPGNSQVPRSQGKYEAETSFSPSSKARKAVEWTHRLNLRISDDGASCLLKLGANMQIAGKTDDQILAQADRDLRSNKWHAVGIVVLILAALSKGWTVHIETAIENATTAEIILRHKADDCSSRQLSDGNNSHCNQVISEQTAARQLLDSLRSNLPNVVLLAIFGTRHAETTKQSIE
jgi:hypothetical protein